ncbi:MAG: ferredoxin--NADP reductase [Acidimicrobiia bacterium]
MGQRIDVQATPLGEVAVFVMDRTLTGQDGHSYSEPPHGHSPADHLARRLFIEDGDIKNVFISSNTVVVDRAYPWEEESLDAAIDVIADLFTHHVIESREEAAERLRALHYNATISRIRAHHSDLWVLWAKPDGGVPEFKPGQYTTLGLGYWEERVDHVSEDFEEDPGLWEKMVRRSYSVSSSIVDDEGNLLPARGDEVEFYVVLVRPGEVETPALTPRLFAKSEGDRIYMSRKFTGRYTLDGVESHHNVVLLATGTGEAPHNAMVAELLRQGHEGRILAAVTVRYRSDLAYLEQHQVVQAKYPNYTYVPMTTREPENLGNKVYIQDFILSGALEENLGAPLDPETTHVFVCGNPNMIGLPKWDEDDVPHFPDPLGVCQILHERGFVIDHRKVRGNVHYEEYWKLQ